MSIREHDPAVFEDLMKRMRRIEGQARGIQRLLEENADCEDIVIQLSAMKSALSRVGLMAASCHLSKLMADEVKSGGTGRQAFQQMMDTFLKL
jgi:CsoR family transcriptional regulator, copper-sensing transcriptional repressor